MVAYRFCRPDDREVLIKAINTCVLSHLPDQPTMTFEGYQRALREMNLWASSSLIATENARDDVVAVLIGCKREHENLIYLFGNRNRAEGFDHLNHMMDSLCKKLAVLGPSPMWAEVHQDSYDVLALFEGAGFKRERVYADIVYTAARTVSTPLVLEDISIDQAEAAGCFEGHGRLAWARQSAAIRNLEDEVEGKALISDSGVAMYSFVRQLGPGRVPEVLAIGGRPDLCLRRLDEIAGQAGGMVHIPRIAEEGIPEEVQALDSFVIRERYYGLHREADENGCFEADRGSVCLQ